MKLRLQRDGRTIDLNGFKQLGSGGEAIVYALNGTPWAAKVYSKVVNGRAEKLRVMLANPPKDPTAAQGHVSIAWPQDLLIDQHSRVVGFVMTRVEQMRRMFDFYNPGTRRKKCPLFTYKYLVATALNLAIAVRALHQRGYVMGDINESNFLVADNTTVTLVDTDSFQVREPGNGRIHHCTVASPLFTPREMQGVDFTVVERREEQDLFGFGVLLFQLLMEGSHPFQARFTGAGDSPEPIEMIRLGNFPHGTGSAMWQPPPVAPAFGMLDPKLRSLFTRCFVNGHRDPKARPTADEWCANLKETLGILIPCKVNPSHLHWPHITRCPWCERKEKLGGRDPFPHPNQVQSGAHLARASSARHMPVSEPARPITPPVAQPAQTPAVPWWKRIIGVGSPVAAPVSAAAAPAPVSPIRPVVASAPSSVVFPAAAPAPVSAVRPTAAAAPVSKPIPAPTPSVILPSIPHTGMLVGTTAKELAQAQAGWMRKADLGGGTILELCGIPAGNFTMGGRGADETRHQVNLTKAFWLGRTPVTQGQWEILMGNSNSQSNRNNLPVVGVRWGEAEEFCAKLNAKGLLPSGWHFTLPTEAQWEYACRAGTTDEYVEKIESVAWFSNNCHSTRVVATKLANAWGLHDMHGNVWEWCADWYGSYDAGSITDPAGPKTGSDRVTRGGSWSTSSASCRAADRNRASPNSQSNNRGFRVVAVPAVG